MKAIIKFFVEHTIISNLILILMMFLGISSIFSIKKELRPEISMDYVVVTSRYSGASPVEMEQLMVIPIEQALNGISGIDTVSSVLGIGMAVTAIGIDFNYTDKTSAIQSIFRALTSVQDLPDDAEDLVIREIRSQNIPILNFSLFGNVSEDFLYKWSKFLKDRLETIDGVSEVEVTGVKDPTIDIIVDPAKMEKNSVSITEIMNVVSLWNKSAPAGYLNEGDQELLVRIDENYRDISNISELVIRTNDFNKKVTISDVAKVSWGNKYTRVINRYNGKRNAQLQITKRDDVDTMATADQVKAMLVDLRTSLPKELDYEIFRDESEDIKSSLNGMTQNAVIGLILVTVSLFLLLNWRIALVTALGLPFSFFASIWAMEKLGYTLNTITIIGIILVMGMLVDNGIVIAENIFYHLEKGRKVKDASIIGTKEIVVPVLGTVLTTIASFLPLVFMTGMAGRFLSIIPVGIIICLIFSLIECIILLPNHASLFMKPETTKSRLSDIFNNFLQNTYRPVLNFSVTHRYLVSGFVFILIASLFAYFIGTFKMQLFSRSGVTNFNFSLTGPISTNINESDKIAVSIEQILHKYVGKEITGYRTTVGGTAARRFATKINSTNDMGFRVYLPDTTTSDSIDPTIFTESLRNQILEMLPQGWNLSFDIGVHGPSMGSPVDIQIGHSSFDYMEGAAAQIESKLRSIKGVTDITNSLEKGFKEYQLQIDKVKMSTYGIALNTLQAGIYSAFEGMPATIVKNFDEEYEVLVMYPKNKEGNSSQSILSLRLPTKYGTYVPLSSFAKLAKVDALSSIMRVDKKRTISLTASTTNEITAYEVNQQMEEFINTEVRPKYSEISVKFAGEEEQRREMVGDLLKLFIVAIVVIYMVLCLTFDSALYPFFVMLIIPIGVTGGLVALKMFGEIVNLPGLVSFVGLSGIVINDSIILITYIKDLFKDTGDIMNAIVEGGVRRIRPIFLTTATTMFGLLPGIFEMGGKDANMRPMSIVIAFGLLLATIMTTTFIPAFMGCVFDVTLKFRKKKSLNEAA